MNHTFFKQAKKVLTFTITHFNYNKNFVLVPSEPLSLTEGDKTAQSFAFTWREPFKIPGILQDYGIVIERTNAVHFIPDDCSVGGESDFAVNVEADVNEFVYEGGLPSFRYRVNVNASTRVGNGDAAEIYVVTLNDGMCGKK